MPPAHRSSSPAVCSLDMLPSAAAATKLPRSTLVRRVISGWVPLLLLLDSTGLTAAPLIILPANLGVIFSESMQLR
jgi:hypothetical protein